MRMRRLLKGLASDRSGVALIEFGLALPLFLGFVLAGIEMANYVMANNRTQRLATMAADLVAQSGAGAIGASEAQIYDLFSALDLTAQPFDLRNDGRIVITAVKGTDQNADSKVESRILWQRFDGQYVVTPEVGCNQTTSLATLPDNRTMALDELLFHVQVPYRYQPIFSSVPFQMLSLPVDFSRHAMFRARSTQFQTPTPDTDFPPKTKCASVTGL